MRPGPRRSLRGSWLLLARYLRPQVHLVVALGVLLLVGVGFRLAAPLFAAEFVGLVVEGEPPLSNLMWLAAAVCATGLLDQVCTMSGAHLGARVSWTATNRLREDLAEHALSLDIGYHREHGAGEMIERIDGDARELTNFFAVFAVKLAVNLLVIVGVIAVLMWVDWRLGLGYLTFCLLALYLFHRVRGAAAPRWRQAREASTELYGRVLEWFSGLPDIRGNGGESYVRRRFAQGLRRQFHRTRDATNLSLGISHGSTMVLVLGATAVLSLAVVLLQANVIDLGIVVALLLYTRIANTPLQDIVDQIADLQRAAASVDRIEELFATRPSITSGPGLPPSDGPVAIAFEGVSFSYPSATADDATRASGSRNALRNVSFALRPGEVLGLVGRTGSGKTTITRLLLRLYDPTAGRISMNGHDIRNATLQELRRNIGVVNQDVHLFSATVRDNLTLYGERRADRELEGLLHELGLGDWYSRLAAGLDTVLTGAKSLSAGEAQLLAVARIFATNPGLVVLDEPTSRLDPVSERLVQRAFDRLLEKRTAIIIAHRLSTLDRADTVLVLRQGEVCEYGPRTMLAADEHSAYHRALTLSGTDSLAAAGEGGAAW